MVVTGSCLRGAIGYEVRVPFTRFVDCRCSRRREASGSAHAADAIVPPDALRWTRGDGLAVRFDLPEARSFSSSFRPTCDSPVPRATRSGREVIVPCGGQDADPGEEPSVHAQWASRAPWTSDPGDLPTT